MSHHNEMGILRRFNDLNFKNLLYLQAELVDLEKELERLSQADSASIGSPQASYEKHWPLLRESESDGSGDQLAKFLQIRDTLDQYNKTLATQIFLSKQRKPRRYEIDFLRDWMVRPSMGNFPIISADRHAWDEDTQYDLISLSDQPETDLLNTFVSTVIIPIFHSLIGRHFRNPSTSPHLAGTADYSDSKIARVLDVFGTMVSSLFPISSIVILHLVDNMGRRIAIIAIFTAFFSLCLAIMTKARKIEIFAATAAFAAVQVVFISTNIDSARVN